MKRMYVVTGALGHLGNTLIKMLVSRGEKVRGIALAGDLSCALDNVDVELLRADIRDAQAMKDAFTAPGYERVVIHTAGIVSIASKYNDVVWDVNVNGTANVVEQCRNAGVDKLIYISSVHAIPEKARGQSISEVDRFDPELVKGLYAKTKAAATQICLDAACGGLDVTVVHPSGIIGPNDYGHGHLTQMIMDYLDGRLTAVIRGGYDFVDVRDVSEGIIKAADMGESGTCYILSGKYASIPTLVEELHEVSGKRSIHTILPAWFAKATAPLAEAYYKLLHQPPLFTRYSLYTLNSNAVFDDSLAREKLSYQPRELMTTLSDTVRWLVDNHRVHFAPTQM